MKNKSLLYRFNAYQKERFPIAVLIFTTLSVVLSSAVIVLTIEDSIVNHIPAIIIGTITALLFMFHMRVFDDQKDKQFDTDYHPERPVQKGIINIKELNFLNAIGLSIQFLLNVFFSLYAFLWLVLALGYSLIARAEFFMKQWIKKRFFLYNVLNLLQLFFVQIYLYALFNPEFSWENPLLFIHFIFALSNAALIEVGRKLKRKNEETEGRDTYSARLGMKFASVLFAGVYLTIYWMFSYMLFSLAETLTLFYISLIPLGIIITSTIIYLSWDNKLSPKLVEGSAILFYLSTHLLLAFTRV
jgi:4-hydroxybenzoate polyprenyltransferase